MSIKISSNICSDYRNFGQPKRHIAAMARDLGADLGQRVPAGWHRFSQSTDRRIHLAKDFDSGSYIAATMVSQMENARVPACGPLFPCFPARHHFRGGLTIASAKASLSFRFDEEGKTGSRGLLWFSGMPPLRVATTGVPGRHRFDRLCSRTLRSRWAGTRTHPRW